MLDATLIERLRTLRKDHAADPRSDIESRFPASKYIELVVRAANTKAFMLTGNDEPDIFAVAASLYEWLKPIDVSEPVLMLDFSVPDIYDSGLLHYIQNLTGISTAFSHAVIFNNIIGAKHARRI